MFQPAQFFDLEGQEAAPLFEGLERVWEALGRIAAFLRPVDGRLVAGIRRGGEVLSRTHVLWQGRVLTEGFELRPGDVAEGRFEVFSRGERLEGATVIYAGAALLGDDIELGQGVVIEPGALIKGPTRIGDRTEVRQGAYIRGSCHIGRACVVGHATELKNAVLLDGAKAAHFAYVGDSILGRGVNLGAGSICSNFKMTHEPVTVRLGGEILETGMRKLGAILGDGVEIGCNAVLNPGTLIGPRSLVYPTASVRGYHPAGSVIKLRQGIETAPRR